MAKGHEGISFTELAEVSSLFIFEEQYPTEVLMRMRIAAAEALESAPWAHGRETGEHVLELMDKELAFRFGQFLEEQVFSAVPEA